MPSDVLYATLLIAYPFRRIASTQLFHETLSHFVHLPREIDSTDTFQYRVVDVHWIFSAKRRSVNQ